MIKIIIIKVVVVDLYIKCQVIWHLVLKINLDLTNISHAKVIMCYYLFSLI